MPARISSIVLAVARCARAIRLHHASRARTGERRDRGCQQQEELDHPDLGPDPGPEGNSEFDR